jgi:branched-chain amino acid transport system permease protein
MANVYGAILGAIVLVGAPELFRPLQDVRLLGYGLLLLLLVRFRPQGLLGSR